MRRTLLALLLAASVPAFAQQPANLEPIPEPPPDRGLREVANPSAIFLQRGEDTVTEYRIRGKLYMVKVTPPHGVPYYLIDKEGNGQMVRDDATPDLAVPMWVIKSW